MPATSPSAAESASPAGGSVHHPLFARVYARFSSRAEARLGVYRDELLAGLSGRVIEIGAGNGLNFAHYPSSVTELLAVEPEPHLRGVAERAASRAAIQVRVLDGLAGALPFAEASFDHAVFSLVLCSVSEPQAALLEARRVLVPGGGLRYWEHVVARGRAAAAVQRGLDATLWPRLAGGCHLARDTGAAIRAAGFAVERERRVAISAGALEPAVPHILGVASRV